MCRARFISLWNRCVTRSGPDNAENVFAVLNQNYSLPDRHYHTFDHIKASLGHLDDVREQSNQPDALEMAVWFHDAIYDARAKDNELRSAELFVRVASKNVPKRFIDMVHDLIMVTVHPSEPKSGDEKLMVDIDLSSFGLPWPQFIALGELARKEFPHLSDREFHRNELEFFEMLGNRPQFYFSEFFRARYEAQARDNLERKIADLRSRVY